MPNLDPKGLRYMSKDEFRVLTAVEMGMKNHELVPTPLIESISGLKRGGAFKLVKLLCKNKLVAHDSKPYDGYRLTGKGYDYLALKALSQRGSIAAVGIQIGVGKESDIFTVSGEDGSELCLKLHRLGRSFRTIKQNRDYLKPGQAASWLYMSRLSALKEYAFMKALHEKGFPVPTPIDVNRHCVVMSLAPGYQLNSIQVLRHPSSVFDNLMRLACRLASCGLIHCDFNEFNTMVDDEENVTLIDFPQMVSTYHPNASWYFDRDVECMRVFFSRRFGFEAAALPKLATDGVRSDDGDALDAALSASGWSAAQASELERVRQATGYDATGEGGDEEEGEEEEESESEEESEEEAAEAAAGALPTRSATLTARAAAAEAAEAGAAETGEVGGGGDAYPALAPASAGAAAADDHDDAEEERAAASAAVLLEAMALARAPAGVAADAATDGAAAGGVSDDADDGGDDGASAAPLPPAGGRARTAASVTVRSSTGRLVDVDVTARVRRDLQKKGQQRAGKGSRNEHKDREKRKLASSVKASSSGGGWG